jgi:glycosyltransferase involved in cell wall biosynthesis
MSTLERSREDLDRSVRSPRADPGRALGNEPGRGRLAVVCAGCGLGGSVARVAIRQAEILGGHHYVTLLSESFPLDLTAQVFETRVTPRRFDGLRRLCHVPNALAFAQAIDSALGRLRSDGGLDLALFHDLAQAALAGRSARRKWNLPYAVCAHEDIRTRPRSTYGLLHRMLHTWATPRAYQGASLVLALSPEMARRAAAYGAEPNRVALVPVAVDVEELGLPAGLATGTRAPGTGPLRLLYVGRFAPEKDVATLLQACAMLRDRDVPFSLGLVGEGPLRPQLEAAVDQHGLSRDVRFLGIVPHERIGEHYVDADILCVPSIDEPFGTVALECLMAGTPVIATRVGGLPLTVRQGVNGLLVSPGDAGELAAAIEGIHGDRQLLARMRQSARGSVYPRFAWKGVEPDLLGSVGRALRAHPRTTEP